MSKWQVGFNAGDGSNYYSVPGSQTDQILSINSTSNVLVPGRWVFRIDGRAIEAGGCGDEENGKTLSQIAYQIGSWRKEWAGFGC